MNTILQRYGTTLRIYDNGGKTADRYTIIPPRWARAYRARSGWDAIASGDAPFHPQGFGQSCIAMPGPHLGRRIRWDALPADVKKFARQSFPEFCPVPMRKWNIEVTDTFAGEANYAWVRRYSVTLPDDAKTPEIVRAVKREAGISGRHVTYNHGDMLEIRPRGACIVVFANLEH